VAGLNTTWANGKQRDFVSIISNLPTGDLQYLNADYVFTVTNTGNSRR
jgi:hypothetical protein